MKYANSYEEQRSKVVWVSLWVAESHARLFMFSEPCNHICYYNEGFKKYPDLFWIYSCHHSPCLLLCSIELPTEQIPWSFCIFKNTTTKLRGIVIELFKWYYRSCNKGDISKVLSVSNQDIKRSNVFKLDRFTFRREIRKNWLSI